MICQREACGQGAAEAFLSGVLLKHTTTRLLPELNLICPTCDDMVLLFWVPGRSWQAGLVSVTLNTNRA